MRIDNFYFVVEDVEKSIRFYSELLNKKPTNITGKRWADWENENNQIYFGIISKEASESKLIKGNNGVLGLYTENIDEAYKKCLDLEAKILYKPEEIQNSVDNYKCFAIEDLDGNKIEISYYDKQDKRQSILNEEIVKDSIPESVLQYGFDFDWDEKDVWKLDYPQETIDIEELEWHFSVPFWDWENGNYNLTPNQVMADKGKYEEQYNRIMNSNIEYPIDIMENKGKYVILDGLHRLAKCRILGYQKVNVRIIPRIEIPNISK